MDSRRPRSHPNTLGQAWRRASQPRRGNAENPPTSDWQRRPEERPEERSFAEWPSLGPSPSLGERGGATSAYDLPDAQHHERATDARRPASGLWSRWRDASRKTRVMMVAAIVLPLLLIAGCSSLALHALGGVGAGVSSPLLSAQATQQASAVNGTAGSTATATHVATKAPTSVATHAPTSAPSPALTLAVTCASGSVHGAGKVCVQTQPSATLSITVRYCDGTDAKGLHGSATADSSGAYTWTWTVRSTCVGAATAMVTAQWQGKQVTATKTFTITA